LSYFQGQTRSREEEIRAAGLIRFPDSKDRILVVDSERCSSRPLAEVYQLDLQGEQLLIMPITIETWCRSLQGVAGSYPGYTGRCASLLGKTALDPNPTSSVKAMAGKGCALWCHLSCDVPVRRAADSGAGLLPCCRFSPLPLTTSTTSKSRPTSITSATSIRPASMPVRRSRSGGSQSPRGSEDLALRVVENVQHPATFAIQLDLVSKCLRVAGCFGLIDVVGNLRQRVLADNAIIYFVSNLLISMETDPAEFSAVGSIPVL